MYNNQVDALDLPKCLIAAAQFKIIKKKKMVKIGNNVVCYLMK